jgi:hypothetical protein
VKEPMVHIEYLEKRGFESQYAQSESTRPNVDSCSLRFGTHGLQYLTFSKYLYDGASASSDLDRDPVPDLTY